MRRRWTFAPLGEPRSPERIWRVADPDGVIAAVYGSRKAAKGRCDRENAVLLAAQGEAAPRGWL